MSEPRKYYLSLARAYAIKNGYWSVEIKAEEFDALQKVELGGKLVLRILPDESKKSDTSPDAYFQYISPKELSEMKSRRQNTNPRASKPFPKKSQPKSEDEDY